MGCDTCHTTHKTGEVGKAEFDFHLTKAAPALCIDCHDVKDASLHEGSSRPAFRDRELHQCHDPHQSAVPKLMRQFLHPPFADKVLRHLPRARQRRQSCA